MKNLNREEIFPGFLLQVSAKTGNFFHLTWKKEKKTITKYIRLDEVKRVKQGIKAYKRAKKKLNDLAFKNLNLLIAERKKK